MTKIREITIGIIHNGMLYLSLYASGEKEVTEKVVGDRCEQGNELG